jgi:hypothetical protein
MIASAEILKSMVLLVAADPARPDLLLSVAERLRSEADDAEEVHGGRRQTDLESIL